MSKEAMKLALAYVQQSGFQVGVNEVIFALQEALAEQPAQQEPESFEKWYAKQHGDPEEIGFLQALRITYCAGQDSVITPQPAQQTACTWAQPDSDHMPDTWEATCGAMWTFTEGGPKDNDMHFCPNCGKPAIEAKLKEKNNG